MKSKFKKSSKIVLIIAACAVSVAVVTIGYTVISKAEQSGSSPNNGATTSRIKTIYDALATLTFGSDAVGLWGDWGAYWNRIYSAAIWVPSGNAGVADVKNAKTFNNTSRTQQTGTYPNPTNCSTQLFDDSHGAPVTETTNCSLIWTTAASPVSGDDDRTDGPNPPTATRGGYDPRTGLIWSQLLLRTGTVIGFSHGSNSVFSWKNTAANNIGITAPVAGNRTAIQLCADQGLGWRLPTQKELMQAYIDGAYFNLTQSSNGFWSATEEIAGYSAYAVALLNGYTVGISETSTNQIRCVR